MARANLFSASLRHLLDAEHLLASGEHRSVDQAYHLAGFAPECARKGCFSLKAFDLALGHELSGREEALLQFAAALDPAALRYRIGKWGEEPALSAWSPQARYWPTGHCDEVTCQQLVDTSARLVNTLLAVAWTDGAWDAR